jgi:putative heme-binding domain-containing protein
MTICLLGMIAAFAEPPKEPPLVAPEGPRSPQEQQKMFHLPPGFKIELIAAEPDIRKPMNLAFDRHGRLFSTQSIEYPFPAKDGSKPRDTVQVFTDSNGDGVPDKRHTYADRLNIPIGVVPVGDDAIVYCIPEIRRFEGVDPSGKAVKQTPIYTGFGFRDTHGMASSFTRHLDGWIYACHGYANDSKVQGKEPKTVAMLSGNTYRFKPDGSRIEQWTWGQVNPFGMAFDSLGNQFTADCHTKPVYNLIRGSYYPSFEKPHDGMGFGPEMMEHLHGSTGIAGVVAYEADAFPAEYRGNLFIGNPVTGRINRDRIEYKGSTLKAVELPDFLWCDDLWFRPVDIKLAPDGSLYIADFYNCMIGHYEVPLLHPRRDRERGRIWRVSFEAAKANPKAGDLASLPIEALVGRLGDSNIVVRMAATNEVVDRKDSHAEPLLRKKLADPNADARVHAMWALERTFGLNGAEVFKLRKDTDRKVRTHLVKLIAERGLATSEERDWLAESLNDSDPFVRRAAADALGRHIERDQIPILLAAIKKADPQDAAYVHTLRLALRDHLKKHQEAFANQYEPQDFKRIADATLGIHTRNAGDFMVRYLKESGDWSRIPEMVAFAIRRCRADKVSEALDAVERLRRDQAGFPQQNAAVRAATNGFAQRGTPTPPKLREWVNELALHFLDAPEVDNVRTALELVRDLKVAAGFDHAAEAVTKPKFGELRPLAMEAMSASDATKSIPVLAAILDNNAEPSDMRRRAAESLGGMTNLAAARAALLQAAPIASQDLAAVVVRGLVKNVESAKEVVKLFDERKISVLLARDPDVHANLERAKIADYDAKRAKWLKDAPSEDAALAKLLDERRKWATAGGADLKAGEAVFTKHCGICHQIAGKGSKIGPQLDGVGVRDVDRILEDILAPSRNVDQAFRATQLVLADGRAVSGLFLREEGETVVLADNQGKEQRYAKKDVEERRVSPVSPMPTDVALRMSENEIRDLVAYLLQQRTQAKK